MKNYQKITLAVFCGLVCSFITLAIGEILKININFLVGWFFFTGFFATLELIRYKEGKEIYTPTFGTYLLLFAVVLFINLIGISLHIPKLIMGLLCGLIWGASTNTIFQKIKN